MQGKFGEGADNNKTNERSGFDAPLPPPYELTAGA